MPSNDTTIFNVDATEPDPINTVAQLAGASATAGANAVSASQESNPVSVNLTGAAALAEANGVTPPITRALRFDGPLNNDRIEDFGTTPDGFRFLTRATANHPSLSDGTFVSVTNGGAGSTSELDTRVMPSEQPPTTDNGVAPETVLPDGGTGFFIRMALREEVDYGTANPRNQINLYPNSGNEEFDVEAYMGWSLFLPSNFDIEEKPNQMAFGGLNARASSSLVSFRMSAASGGQIDASDEWVVRWYLSDTSTQDQNAAVTFAEVGTPVRDDIASGPNDWVRWVFRYRMNPFSVTTNASDHGGKNQVYEGNKGILQVWKTSLLDAPDANGNRPYNLTNLNKVDEPVGLVPHATELVRAGRFNMYKFGWFTRSTSVGSPIWCAWDSIRHGEVIKHGTQFSDVSADGSSMPA